MATLNRIRLQGFKSIQSMDLNLRPLNVLIGANGSGKSNFLSFFRLLNAIVNDKLEYFVRKSGGAGALLRRGSKQAAAIAFELYFETEKGENIYGAVLESSAGDSLFFADEYVSFAAAGTTPGKPASLGSGHTESVLNRNEKLGPVLVKTASAIKSILNAWRVYHFHDTSDTAAVKQTSDLEDNKYLRHDGGNLAAFLYWMRNKELSHYKRIVSVIRQIAPFFDDFILEPTRLNPGKIMLEWREKEVEHDFQAHQMSDGTLRFVCLAAVLLQPRPPALLILDEPELGLHPYAIDQLAALLGAASDQTQIIASTQSVTLVDALEAEDLIVVNREFGDSVFRRYDSEQLSNWMESYSLGDLWLKNVLGGRPST